MLTLSHFISAQWCRDEPAHQRLNPSDTREVIAESPEGGELHVGTAVQAARSAFPKWSAATPEARGDLLDRVASLLLERRESIGTLLAREEGKTRPEGIAEVVRAARIFRYFAGESLRQRPYAQRAGYDLLMQAAGGLMSITGRADDEAGGGPWAALRSLARRRT